MIRGIILLILSCVVLTLQTTTTRCSCETNPGSTIYEEAQYYYPMHYVDRVDVTQMPHDGVKMSEFYNSLTQENYFANTPTNIIEGLLNVAIGDCNIVERLLLVAHESLAHVKIELRELLQFIGIKLNQLNSVVSGIYSPFHACVYTLELLKISSRLRSAEKCEHYLDTTIELDNKYYGILDERVTILRKAVSAGKGLDDKARNCGGGLLGIKLLCGRLDLLKVVEGVLRTVLDLIASLLSAFKIHLDDYFLILNSILTSPENDGIFSKITTVDLIENTIATEIREIHAQLEHNEPITMHQIKERLDRLCSDEQRMRVFNHLVSVALRVGYKISDHRLTCSGEGPSTCEFRGLLSVLPNIDIEADINLGSIHLSDVIRTIILGLTGSESCRTTIISVGLNGEIVIGAEILSGATWLTSFVVSVTPPIKVLNLPLVEETLQTITGTVLGMDDRNGLISEINILSNRRKEIVNEICEASPLALSSLDRRADAEILEQIERETVLQAIKNAADRIETGEIINQRVIESKKEQIEDFKALLKRKEIDAQLAKARVASCTEDIYYARLDRLNHPESVEYSQVYETRVEDLKSTLALALKIQQQCDNLEETLNLRITLEEETLLGLQVSLPLRLDRLISGGILDTIESLKLQAVLNPHNLLDPLSEIISAVFPGFYIVDPVWINVNSASPLGLDLSIQGPFNEDLENSIESQCSLIKRGVELITGRTCSCERRDLSTTTGLINAHVDVLGYRLVFLEV